MVSRVEKNANNSNSYKRVTKNQDLYEKIYDDTDYSVSGKVIEPITNEIDINEIRNLLSQNHNANKIVKEKKEIELPHYEEENIHDINEMLDRSRKDRNDDKDEYRSLKNIDILRNLQVELKQSEKYKEEEKELKELINTITYNSELNKLNNRELSLDLLEDLKSNTTVMESTAVKKVLVEEPKEKGEEKQDIDKSFYTSSMDFKKQDFEHLKDLDTSLKKSNKLMKWLLIALIIIVISSIALLLSSFL